MDPVRTLAAYLLLAIAASGSAQQTPALSPTPAIYMPVYTLEPAAETTLAPSKTVIPPAPAVTETPPADETPVPEATATPMPGGITRILYRRLTGEDVAVVQQQLINLGYLKGKADGVFGNNTYAAVIQFQLAHDLEPDGIVGENTLTWLFSGEAIALPTATPEPTPELTSEPTPTPVPTPSPTPTPVPTAQIPESWTVPEGVPCPVSVQEGGQIVVDGETLADIAAYTDEQAETYLPLRALVQALSYPEYVHENGSSYEFTVMPDQRVITLGCEADADGWVMQAMVMLDGYFFVPDTPYRLLRWGEEIYMPVTMWNELVKAPCVEIVTDDPLLSATPDEVNP